MSLANNILGYNYLIISIEVESENFEPSKYWYLIFEILVTSGQKLVIFQRSTIQVGELPVVIYLFKVNNGNTRTICIVSQI